TRARHLLCATTDPAPDTNHRTRPPPGCTPQNHPQQAANWHMCVLLLGFVWVVRLLHRISSPSALMCGVRGGRGSGRSDHESGWVTDTGLSWRRFDGSMCVPIALIGGLRMRLIRALYAR